MILRSILGVLNGLCFMLNVVLRFYSEWNIFQLYYNMLIISIVFGFLCCMLGIVFVNFCVSFKVKIVVGSFEFIFVFFVQVRVKLKKEGKGKFCVYMNFILCIVKGSWNVNKDFYFLKLNMCEVVYVFFFFLLGNCFVCVYFLF